MRIPFFRSGKSKPDPVRHCRVYKLIGCAHVDGFLCDMETCTIRVMSLITPKDIVQVESNPTEGEPSQKNSDV